MLELMIENIHTYDRMYVVKIPTSKTYVPRTFTISDKYFDVVKKYISLRPKRDDNKRFFLSYRNKKCTRQAIGRTTFYKMPKEIATYLKLNNPERYTGKLRVYYLHTSIALREC